ncbi:MAG: ATP-binding cassette domain-containing protein [Clostridiales bacterium]|jgi:NitT/TauT family transport system ATP-binding protein|nr:ATP-binding cassette domain-containing protein [Clostridiales bacterium]
MAIELIGLNKAFGDKRVLSDFSLRLERGITCIMGPSGKGKTTIVNILAGLIRPDSGEVNIPPDTKFSFVFQEDRLLEWESALTNVTFVTAHPKQNVAKALELLAEADLSDSVNKRARELSGGMKRRVTICRALIADYDIIILDEPFKGLDAKIKPRIMDMVRNHTQGKFALIITHDPAEAEYLGGRLIDI